MRLSARELNPQIVTAPDSLRPIRIRTGAMTFMLTEAEALELANKLADAVGELKSPRALQFFNTGKDQP